MQKQRWTESENEYLKKNLRTKTTEQMAKKLGRSIPSIRGQLTHLGFHTPRKDLWTCEEEQILKENWDTKTNHEIVELLNGKRSLSSVGGKLLSMGLVKEPIRWTVEENKKFKELYPISTSDKELKEIFPNKSGFATHASNLGIKKETEILHKIMIEAGRNRRVFSENEEKELERFFKIGLSRKDIASKFPSHTFASIRYKLKTMGLINIRKPRCIHKVPIIKVPKIRKTSDYNNRWSEEEDANLAMIFRESKDKILQEFPNLTWKTLCGRMRKLGLYRGHLNKKMTDEQFLKLYREGTSDNAIGKKFKLSSGNVGERRKRLGLPVIPRKKKQCTDRIAFDMKMEREIVQFLKEKKNLTGYIRSLIEEDRKREQK